MDVMRWCTKENKFGLLRNEANNVHLQKNYILDCILILIAFSKNYESTIQLRFSLIHENLYK